MHYELYVDSLFFMNFIMNLYLLILVDRSIMHAASLSRLILGAAAGALGFLLPFSGTGAVMLRLGAGMFLGTAGMLCLAFRVRSLRMFLKLLERLTLYSFGMGGALLFLTGRLSGTGGIPAGALGAAGAGGLAFLLFRRFRYGMNMRNSLCRARLIHNGEKREITALVDSGNSLTEPVSGKPVCVLDRRVFEELGMEEDKGFRAIPYHSIGKKRGILPGYLLSGMELELEGMVWFLQDVYIAVGREDISVGGNAGAESVKMIVNPGLFAGGRKGKPLKRRDKRENDSENNITGKSAVQDDTQGEFVPAQKRGNSLYRRRRGTASAAGAGEGEPGNRRPGDGI